MSNRVQRIDPVDRWYRQQRVRRWAYIAIFLYLVWIGVYWTIFATVPVDYVSQENHFKYGSIGSDTTNGIPFVIWKVLPEMFPEYLPDQAAYRAIPENERDYLDGYAQFGFLVEDGHDTPIGFSKRRDQIMRVGMNCAVCHVSTLRVDEEMDPIQVYGNKPEYLTKKEQRMIVLGMPANTVNLQLYFQFLFDCAADSKFTDQNILAFIRKQQGLNWKEWAFYSIAAKEFRESLLTRRQQLDYLRSEGFPEFGPGRVDTFTPYKRINFGFAYDDTIGTSDFPSIWNQRPRVGLQLHWDGNNKSVFERNLSASIGAGATPVSVDMPRMLRVAKWTGSPDPHDEINGQVPDNPSVEPAAGEMQIPKFPYKINESLAYGLGKAIYRQHCYSCHDWDGEEIGKVVAIDRIETDRHRLDSYTVELAANQNTLGAGHWWRFTNFRKTHGYANMPLDGIWARAPYLHNGSVPTLEELLKSPEQRIKEFYRGDDAYDHRGVGFRSDRSQVDGRNLFLFDTRLPGNSNSGHVYGTNLNDNERKALLEYLKTL